MILLPNFLEENLLYFKLGKAYEIIKKNIVILVPGTKIQILLF